MNYFITDLEGNIVRVFTKQKEIVEMLGASKQEVSRAIQRNFILRKQYRAYRTNEKNMEYVLAFIKRSQ